MHPTLPVLLASMTLACGALAQTTYTVQDLGFPSGETAFNPIRMDETGRVIGSAFTPATGETRAYLYENGVFTPLGTYQGLGRTDASDLDPGGVVVGSSWSTQGFPARAWSWQNGTFTNLGTLGGSYANASAINASGQITGWANVPSPGNFFAYIYQNGVMKNLGETPGDNSSTGFDIADSGDVLSGAFAYIGSWNRSAIGSVREGMHDIGSLGGPRCFGNRMNNLGHITGFADTGALETATSFRTSAFLWRDGIMIDLGALPGYPISVGSAVNDLDEVVGLCWVTNTGPSPTRAFLWRAGVMTDLNAMIEPGSPWVLLHAVSITNDGRILCRADSGSGQRAVILTPNP